MHRNPQTTGVKVHTNAHFTPPPPPPPPPPFPGGLIQRRA